MRMTCGIIIAVLAMVGGTVVAASEESLAALASRDGGSFEFTFEREGLVAHKKWTFSPSGVVCEGMGISAADGSFEVATCVEHAQAAENAGIVYQKDSESCFRNGALVYTVCAPKEAIRFEVSEREGDFNTFMLSHGSVPVRGKVFSLRILHGKKPVDAAYRYIVSVDESLL